MTTETTTLLAGDRHHLTAYPPKPFTVTSARGARLETADGRTLLDLGGANHGVAILGHSHPRVVAAIRDQAERLIHVSQTVPTRERAAFLERLHAFLPESLEKTFPTNSGTEAVECGLKLAIAATGRHGLVAAVNAFHGRTLGSLRLTHKPDYRDPWLPLLGDTRFVPFNNVEALKAAVDREIAAIVLEPIQGEGGIVPATREYLRAARDLATDHGALLFIDEVQTGLGRTGTFLASVDAGIEPDLVAVGKGLAGGVPMGALSAATGVATALPPAGHGSTYAGNPLACAVGASVLDVIREEALPERAAETGARFAARLREIEHPLVREVRGRGLMLAVDLRVRPQHVLSALESRGVLALPAGRTAVRFLPPLVIAEADLDMAADAFAAALGEAPARG